MNWKKHPPTCTCGQCVNDRASRESQKAIAQARMTGQPVPPAPEKSKSAGYPPTFYDRNGPYGYYFTTGGSLSGYNQQQLVDMQSYDYYAIMQRMLGRGPANPNDYTFGNFPDTPTPVTIDSIPEETDLVRGWRTYTIDAQGRLKGSRAAWEAAEFVATCEYDQYADVVSHLLNGCPARGHAGCGIYSHKVGPEYLKTDRQVCDTRGRYAGNYPQTQVNVVAQCISSGVVVEHEHGYRAEKCRIEQMWLVTPRRCANGHWVKMETAQSTEIKWRRVKEDTGRDWMVTDSGVGIPAGVMNDPVAYWNTQAQIEAEIKARNMATPPRWSCSETPVGIPGAAYAQVLSTKYGVPCIAMPTTEFIAKLDEGSL